jgi:tRNA pseudouridine55 synthase
MAAGVLPLCVGKATRIAEYLMLDRKRYRCEMRLGVTTDTQDVWGRVLSESDFSSRLSERLIADTAARFVGELMQTPPAYSAVRVGGKRLYEYARLGEQVSAPARRIEIFRLDIKRVDLRLGVVSFDAECSKGSYMRTLCHDMGSELGCGAAMSGLVRTGSGVFEIGDSHTAEELEAAFSSGASPEGFLTATDVPLRAFPSLRLHGKAGRAFANGVALDIAKDADAVPRGLCRVYGDAEGREGVFLGVGRVEGRALFADKVFFEADKV